MRPGPRPGRVRADHPGRAAEAKKVVSLVKSDTTGREADQVYFGPNFANFVAVTGNDPGAKTTESLWWLTDAGARFGVDDTRDVREALGLQSHRAWRRGWRCGCYRKVRRCRGLMRWCSTTPFRWICPLQSWWYRSETWICPANTGKASGNQAGKHRPADPAEHPAAGGQALVDGRGRRPGGRPAGRHGRHDLRQRLARVRRRRLDLPDLHDRRRRDDDVRRPDRRPAADEPAETGLDARPVHVDAGHAARDRPRVGRQHGRQLPVVPPGARHAGGRRRIVADVGTQARRQRPQLRCRPGRRGYDASRGDLG